MGLKVLALLFYIFSAHPISALLLMTGPTEPDYFYFNQIIENGAHANYTIPLTIEARKPDGMIDTSFYGPASIEGIEPPDNNSTLMNDPCDSKESWIQAGNIAITSQGALNTPNAFRITGNSANTDVTLTQAYFPFPESTPERFSFYIKSDTDTTDKYGLCVVFRELDFVIYNGVFLVIKDNILRFAYYSGESIIRDFAHPITNGYTITVGQWHKVDLQIEWTDIPDVTLWVDGNHVLSFRTFFPDIYSLYRLYLYNFNSGVTSFVDELKLYQNEILLTPKPLLVYPNPVIFSGGIATLQVIPQTIGDYVIQVEYYIPNGAPTQHRQGRSNQFNVIEACLPGQKAESYFSICQNCGAGYFSDGTSSDCIPCPFNTYNSENTASSCLNCNSSYYTQQIGSNSVDQCILSDCPDGYVKISPSFNCEPCSEGRFAIGDLLCELCPQGTFNDQIGQNNCIKCPPGYFQNLTGQTTCQVCPQGTYSDEYGSSVCKKCNPGNYQDQFQQTSCLKCPLGTSNSNIGSSSISDCILCLEGTFSPFEGLHYCIPCGLGYFSNNTGQTICSICPPGHYSSNFGSNKCNLCSPGEKNFGEGAGSCSRCSNGEIAPAEGNTQCFLCGLGEESDSTRSVCIPCPIATYNNIIGSNCKPCPPGFSTIGINATECVIACGNGFLDILEGCDDGNRESGDGCNEICQIENGWECKVPGQPCTQIQRIKQKSNTSAIIIGVTLPSIFFLFFASILFFLYIRRKKKLKLEIELSINQTNEEGYLQNVKINGLLGKGHFGEVWKGTWEGTTVAAKKYFELSLNLKEADILKKVRHPNIINYLGIYKDLEGTKWMITEYMDKGSLDKLLQTEKNSITLVDLLNISRQICGGMIYLGQKGIVHRDLALRNILVTGGGDNKYLSKIADFGLARQMDVNDYYSAKEKEFPIKWTAPEALEQGKFTVKSDVYSFGVLLWELFSYGKVPFAAMKNQEILDSVNNGYQLPRPKNCPEKVYETMKRCWDLEPENRPSFVELTSIFLELYETEKTTIPETERFSFETSPNIYSTLSKDRKT